MMFIVMLKQINDLFTNIFFIHYQNLFSSTNKLKYKLSTVWDVIQSHVLNVPLLQYWDKCLLDTTET